MKKLAVASLVLFVLLAGCSAIGGSDYDTDAYPDGVNTTSVNATVLTAGHDTALDSENFTLTLSVTQGSADNEQTMRVTQRVAADHDRTLTDLELGQGAQTTYMTSDTVYIRTMAGDDESFAVQERNSQTGYVSATGSDLLQQFISQGNYSVEDTTERNGTVYVTLTADEADDDTAAENVESTLVVDEHGVVQSLEHHAEHEDNKLTITLEFSDVGSTTVTEPDWVEEAESQN